MPHLIGDPEPLGHVTVPSGIVLGIDGGMAWLWTHDRPPLLPEGALGNAADERDVNDGADLEITGPDAREAGLDYDRSPHPLYLFDVPRSRVDERLRHFAAFAEARGLQAQARELPQRVPHRRRVELQLGAGGDPRAGVTFHGLRASAVAGLPRGKPLRVVGLRDRGEEFAGRWNEVLIEALPGVKVVGTERRGRIDVNEGRILLADADALGSWTSDASLDGLADVAFWGRDAGPAAEHLGAAALEAGAFGWRDLPVAHAPARERRVAEAAERHGWSLASETRAHSHHWRALEQVRRSPTESATVEVGGADTCLFFTTWGDGPYEVFADLDPHGGVARVRIELGSEDSRTRMRTLLPPR